MYSVIWEDKKIDDLTLEDALVIASELQGAIVVDILTDAIVN